jgi:protein-tyrosine phosphatase
MSDPVILVVCTGNICRSPLAEAALRAALPPGFTVASAGTGAMVDAPPPPELLAVAAAHGLDVAGHRGRQLTERVATEATLLLTMTNEHRSAAVRTAPRVANRTVTFLDAARVAGALDTTTTTNAGDRVRRLIDALLDARAQGTIGAPEADVADPYGRGRDAYDAMAATVLPAAERIAAALR